MERITVERKVLSENERIASELRARFAVHGVRVLNLISSPGSGKTALLERLLESLPEQTRIAALTGDIQTENDAKRLAKFGFPAKQIATGGACHLDARMVARAIEGWDLGALDLLLIENVGNLVCPTSYDLGEECKIVLLSVTEGEDKPQKYPGIFAKAKLVVITKIDLLPYVPFDLEAARANVRAANPGIEIVETSAISCVGLDTWRDWVLNRRHAAICA